MKFVLLGAVISAVAVPVSAQTVDSPFTGPRVEARIGWDRPSIEGEVAIGQDRFTRSAGKSGFGYGGEIGYDADLNGFVIGGYAGFEASTAKECGEVLGNDRGCLRSGRNITAGVRAGAPVGGNFLLYGKGGYSNGRATIDYQDDDLIVPDFREGRSFDGFHLGGGFEATLPGGVYGRLEYVYSNYSALKARVDGDAPEEDLTVSLKPSRHQVTYGLGIRF